MLCNKAAVSFYLPGPNDAGRESGWRRRIIYESRHVRGKLGYNGSLQLIKLSDERIVVTNDLWESVDKVDWVRSVPNDALTGVKLSTRVCRPESRDALEALLGVLVTYDNELTPWKTKDKLPIRKCIL